MAYHDPLPGSLKRKRRRRPDKAPISATLRFDDKLSGDTALLSHDLADDLFPARHDLSQSQPDHVLHIAVSPWMPHKLSSATSAQWTILPCKRLARNASDTEHSSIRISSSNTNIQALLRNFQSSAPALQYQLNASVEVRVTDVVPLPLDAVYVSVDLQALQTWAGVQEQYKGGFQARHTIGHRNKRGTDQIIHAGHSDENATEHDTTRLVTDALKSILILHSGDDLALPLPLHPITYASAPPAHITACEPVAQGLLSSSTRIVVVPQVVRHEISAKAAMHARFQVQYPLAEVDEDTSNEMFYSAAENGPGASVSSTPSRNEASSESSDSEASSIDDLSDDPDDLITMTSPILGSQSSGVMSSLAAATPKQHANYTNGLSTPGSVYSTVTSATLRGAAGGRSKVFRAQGLLGRISDELLYPKPSDLDDEEARVYVETNILGRLGCFSGDWVILQAMGDPSNASLGLSISLLDDDDAGRDVHRRRPVKIFGVPESLSSKTPRYPLGNRTGRRDSVSSVQAQSFGPATLYLSPILLANLDNPRFLSVAPIALPKNVGLSRSLHPTRTLSFCPPFAKEMTLFKTKTPLSTERSLQPTLFSRLREYFEQKQRIVKSGDIIAIPFDEVLGRAVYEGGAADEDVINNDLLSRLSAEDNDGHGQTIHSTTSVAWFQIGDVVPSSRGNDQGSEELDLWNGTVSIDPSRIRMHQSGDQARKLPPAMDNVWQYYEGVRKPPMGTMGSRSLVATVPPPFVPHLQRRLRELVAAATSARAIYLGLPPVAILLHSTQRNIGKAYITTQACHDLGIHVFAIESYDIVSEASSGDVKAEALLRARADRALTCGAQDTALLIRHIEALESSRMSTAIKDILNDSRILIATTTQLDKVPDSHRALFTHELEVSAPDEGDREGILRSIIANSPVALSPAVDLGSIAVKTAALVAGDLVDVVDRSIAAQAHRLEALAESVSLQTGSLVTVRDIQLSGGDSAVSLTPSDFDQAVDDARKNFADSIGAPKIPNVQWSDVGGLANVKEAVIETIQLPLSRPELFAKGLKKRSGILFYGPPGTGKTLLAKAIATEFSLNFFSVKGPELLNMYIGESEANVRRVFQRARDARPCVVFFDELDSVAPKRGNQGDSGGVMDRIVSQLLAELDGMSEGEGSGGGGGGVFVIGATNRPDLLDQALLRPGRFDKMLYLGVSDTHDKQMKIMEALTRKFTLDPTLSLHRVAQALPFTYTGADLYALCSDAMLKAITRSARAVDARLAAMNAARSAQHGSTAPAPPPALPLTLAQFFDHHATDADTAVVVAEEDFVLARQELVPSVSVDELRHYERVRREFEGPGADKAQPNPNTTTIDTGMSNGNGNGASVFGPSNGAGRGADHLLRAAMHMDEQNPTRDASREDSGARASVVAAAAKTKSIGGLQGKGKGFSALMKKIGNGRNGGGAGGAGRGSESPSPSPSPGLRSRSRVEDEEINEDDFVVRTDHLSLNGGGAVAAAGLGTGTTSPAKGVKGKGKAAAVAVNGDGAGFGEAAADEDLYA